MNIESYLKRILKNKNYYIGELYEKLKSRYPSENINIYIKKLVSMGILNDVKLIGYEMEYLIHYKCVSKRYIYNYFTKKKISPSLIALTLNKYGEFDDENREKLKHILKLKGKTDKQIESYLIRNGFENE